MLRSVQCRRAGRAQSVRDVQRKLVQRLTEQGTGLYRGYPPLRGFYLPAIATLHDDLCVALNVIPRAVTQIRMHKPLSFSLCLTCPNVPVPDVYQRPHN